MDSASLTYASGFSAHSTTYGPTIRRFGRMVFITGAITNSNQITAGTTEVTMATLPVGFRPSSRVTFRLSGSGINTYLLIINTNGTMTCSRYGVSSYIAIPSGSWLTISCSFVA